MFGNQNSNSGNEEPTNDKKEPRGVKKDLQFQGNFSAHNATHSLMSLKKRLKTSSKNKDSKRNQKEWLGKIDQPNPIYIETFAQEFYSSICDPYRRRQPKTRIGEHPYNNSLILLTEKINFTPLSKIPKNEFQENILNKKISGLGYAGVMALYFGESDRHNDNIGIHQGYVVGIDQGSHGLKDSENYQPSATTLGELPYLSIDSSYQPSNYFHLYQRTFRNEKGSYVSPEMATNPVIIQEKNSTLMRLIINPDSLIKKFTEAYPISVKKKKAYFNWFTNRNKKFRHAALQIEEFRNYVLSGKNKKLNKYIKQLKSFKTTHSQNFLTSEDEKIIHELKDNFEKLQANALLIQEILDNKNNLEKLKILIAENRQKLVEMGWAPLYIAAEKNHPAIITACLDEKPEFDKNILSSRTLFNLLRKAGIAK